MPRRGYIQTEAHKQAIREAQIPHNPTMLLSLEEKRVRYNKLKREYYQNVKRGYFIAKGKSWRESNWDKVLEANRKSNRKVKYEVLSNYAKGGHIVCLYCGEANLVKLSLDHINNDGKSHRKQIGLKSGGTGFYAYLKRNDFPHDPPLQILCKSCNSKKENARRKII